MASAIVGNTAISARGEENHLVIPRIRTEWPAVTEDDGLPFSPIFVVNLSAIFGCDCWHRFLPRPNLLDPCVYETGELCGGN